jgi:hypothetical protein
MSTLPPDPDDLAPLDPRALAELLEALACAVRPEPLSEARNEQLIGWALEDPLAEPSDAERVESERLRRALDGEGEHAALGLVQALRSAASPSAGAEFAARRALAESNQRLERPDAAAQSRGPSRVYALFGGAAAVLALAASVVLFLAPAEKRDMSAVSSRSAAPLAAQLELTAPHSTQPLFSQKFESGETSARIDRIAVARSRELRDNRYALWGVR